MPQISPPTTSARLEVEAAARIRRTFAIISHPDAGKTTLTEKFLLYAGAVQEAGSVRARAGRRRATSDWMALEQERGISISSTVLQFRYRGHVLNLLDTPGHRDFSEDTYRVLSAADAAVMVLDAAKGIEPQTLKLFEVCRTKGLPLITFVNKCDRPGLSLLELIDQIEGQIQVVATPLYWPVGRFGDMAGLLDLRAGDFLGFGRAQRSGALAAEEYRLGPTEAAERFGRDWDEACEAAALMREIGSVFDPKSFAEGTSSPLLVGSALTNVGIRQLLDMVVELAPAPAARLDASGRPRLLDEPFSGFVFKVQANMNPAHRDHVAFVRVCSGRFERGMVLTHASTGRPFATKYATSVFGAERLTVDEAWPGDVVGLVNASGLRVGDSLYDATGPQCRPVSFPPMPAFPPELVATAHPADLSRYKQFRRGLAQMEQEGVIQVLTRSPEDQNPVLAAVGAMQFEVLSHRMANEFSVPIVLSGPSERTVRLTDERSAPDLARLGGVEVLRRSDGTLLALFQSPYWLARVSSDHPEWTLEKILST